MPDGKKRPRKRSRKNKSKDTADENETVENVEVDQEPNIQTEIQPSTTIDVPVESQTATSSSSSIPIITPAASTSAPAPAQQRSLSKSYPRSNTNTFSKPIPPRPQTQQQPSHQAKPFSNPTHQSNNTSGPTVSFHERTNAHKPSVIPNFDSLDSSQRNYTLSIALPGSIVRNAQTPELQSRLAGHIGRTCAIFNVDEIVVFDDGEGEQESLHQEEYQDDGMGSTDDQNQFGRRNVGSSNFDPGAFLARVLQYLETPQYLRKALFPMHKDLRLAGLLPPLDCPHHLRFQDQSPYREGVTIETPHWANSSSSSNNKRKHGNSSVWVNIGLKDPIEAEVRGVENVPLGTRVTVKIPDYGHRGRLVSPREPVETKGIYWGYSVRLCPSLSQVLVDAPWNSFSNSTPNENYTIEEEDDGYDLVIGTSERGTSLTEIISSTSIVQSQSKSTHTNQQKKPKKGKEEEKEKDLKTEPLPKFKHALIVFGGLSGLEIAVEKDEGIQLNADDAHELFDSWINVVEGQGSRTIRTEEALMIALARLKSTLEILGK